MAPFALVVESVKLVVVELVELRVVGCRSVQTNCLHWVRPLNFELM